MALARTEAPAADAAQRDQFRWKPGPILLLDDFFLDRAENLVRKVTPPRRNPDPIVTGARPDGKGDGCFQPYFTVIRDPVHGCPLVLPNGAGHRPADGTA